MAPVFARLDELASDPRLEEVALAAWPAPTVDGSERRSRRQCSGGRRPSWIRAGTTIDDLLAAAVRVIEEDGIGQELSEG